MEIKSILLNALIGGASGWFMAISASWLHNRYTKNVPEGQKELTYDIEQYRTLRIKENFEVTFAACHEALKLVRESTLMKPDNVNGIIKAKVGMSFRSFGEKLKISLKEISPNLIEVCIESKPKIFWATSDYGKSYENIEIINTHLKATLQTVND